MVRNGSGTFSVSPFPAPAIVLFFFLDQVYWRSSDTATIPTIWLLVCVLRLSRRQRTLSGVAWVRLWPGGSSGRRSRTVSSGTCSNKSSGFVPSFLASVGLAWPVLTQA